MFKYICFFATSAFASLEAGLKASIDMSVIDQAKDVYFG